MTCQSQLDNVTDCHPLRAYPRRVFFGSVYKEVGKRLPPILQPWHSVTTLRHVLKNIPCQEYRDERFSDPQTLNSPLQSPIPNPQSPILIPEGTDVLCVVCGLCCVVWGCVGVWGVWLLFVGWGGVCCVVCGCVWCVGVVLWCGVTN